jgi:hypothetical protein
MATVRSFGAFPWCPFADVADFTTTLGVSDTFYPAFRGIYEAVKHPINEATRWYWCVKSWKTTGYFTTGGGDETAIINFDVTHTRDCQSERDLVCKGVPLIVTEENGTTYNVPGFLSDFKMDSIDLQIGFVESPLLHPRFGMFADEGLFFTWVYFLYDPFGEGDVAAINITQLVASQNALVPITAYKNTPLESSHFIKAYVQSIPVDPIEPPFAALEIEAVEYWPYDPGDGGGPIYDKDTGAQLRAFP